MTTTTEGLREGRAASTDPPGTAPGPEATPGPDAPPGPGTGPAAGPARRLAVRAGPAPLRPSVPAAPVLRAALLAAASLAVLCVLAVVVPSPAVRVGPVDLPGGAHDLRVLVFLVLVALAGSALGIGFLRGALPRAEAAGAGAAVDRSALLVRPVGAAVRATVGAWAALVLLVVVPAWLGLLPLPALGLVLPVAVAVCAPAVRVGRVARRTARRRGLPVLAAGPVAALSGHLVLAAPERPAAGAVVLSGEVLVPRDRPRRPGPGARTGPTAPAGAGRPPRAGEWGFQDGPP